MGKRLNDDTPERLLIFVSVPPCARMRARSGLRVPIASTVIASIDTRSVMPVKNPAPAVCGDAQAVETERRPAWLTGRPVDAGRALSPAARYHCAVAVRPLRGMFEQGDDLLAAPRRGHPRGVRGEQPECRVHVEDTLRRDHMRHPEVVQYVQKKVPSSTLILLAAGQRRGIADFDPGQPGRHGLQDGSR